MDTALIRKIQEQINVGIKHEAELSFLLSNVRKLLEYQASTFYDGELIVSKSDYQYLKFYCDWASHSFLNGTFAQDMLTIFDQALTYMDNPKKSDKPDIQFLLKMSHFKDELHTFLNCNGITNLDNFFKSWPYTLFLYTSIIEYCPLVIRSDFAGRVNIVQVEVDLELANRIVDGQLFYKVSWTVKDKNGKFAIFYTMNSY